MRWRGRCGLTRLEGAVPRRAGGCVASGLGENQDLIRAVAFHMSISPATTGSGDDLGASSGLTFEARRVTLVCQQGIFKPPGLDLPISRRTTYRLSRRRMGWRRWGEFRAEWVRALKPPATRAVSTRGLSPAPVLRRIPTAMDTSVAGPERRERLHP